MREPQTTPRSPTLGFAMIETLVALTLFGIGMLGNMALLAESLRVSRNAVHRTLAVTLAADLGDRIRANRAGGTTYALDPETELASQVVACGFAGPCDSVARAAWDLHEWHQDVISALPRARTRVTVVPVDGTTARLFTIEIRWTVAADRDAGMLAIQLLA